MAPRSPPFGKRHGGRGVAIQPGRWTRTGGKLSPRLLLVEGLSGTAPDCRRTRNGPPQGRAARSKHAPKAPARPKKGRVRTPNLPRETRHDIRAGALCPAHTVEGFVGQIVVMDDIECCVLRHAALTYACWFTWTLTRRRADNEPGRGAGSIGDTAIPFAAGSGPETAAISGAAARSSRRRRMQIGDPPPPPPSK